MNTQVDTIIPTLTIIYCRVSTDAQASDDKVSLQDQAETCLSYAREVLGIKDNLRVFKDDTSGFEFNRSEFDQVKTLMAQGCVKNFIALRVDRITRKGGHLDELRDMYFKPSGINVYTAVDLGRWQWDPYSEHLQNELVNFATLWGKILVEVMFRGKVRRLKNGQTMANGHSPLGFQEVKTDKGRFFIINDLEAQIVRDIFNLYLQGWSIAKIVKHLNGQKTPTYSELRGDNNFKHQNQWTQSYVYRVLTNRVYIGQWQWGQKEKVVIPVPVIISPDDFEKVQKKLKENSKKKGASPKYNYLLSRRLKCVCGRSMVADQRNNGKNLYYRCPCGVMDVVTVKCDKSYFRADLVDAIAWNWLKELAQDKKKLQLKINDYVKAIEKAIEPLQVRKERQQTLKDKATRDQQKLLDQYLADIIDKNLLAGRLETLKGKIEDYDAEIIKLDTEIGEYTQFLDKDLFEESFAWLQEYHEGQTVDLENVTFEQASGYVEKLNLRATILVEDGIYKINLTSRFGHSTLLELFSQSRLTEGFQQPFYFVLSDTLILDFNSIPKSVSVQ